MNEERERLALLSGEDTCRLKCGFLNRAPEAWECRHCEHEKCWHDMRRNEQIAYRAKERGRLKRKDKPKPVKTRSIGELKNKEARQQRRKSE